MQRKNRREKDGGKIDRKKTAENRRERLKREQEGRYNDGRTERWMMTEGALVLEGGSLRSMFTAGVLDVFMEEGIKLSYVNGVSAGTMAGMNYLSGQRGRLLQINEEYLHDKRYMGFGSLMKNRLVFNFDFVFGELSRELLPFDYQAFFNSPQKFEAVATRCRTGKPEFFEKGSCKEMIKAVQASASMPLLSRMVTVNRRKYLDGGISLPIAYQRAMDLGYEKVVLILTRHKGYRKKPLSRAKLWAYGRYFAPLPGLRAALLEIPGRYNRMQEEIDRLEREGRVFVIRPEDPVRVSRLERNMGKLRALYREGERTARRRMPALQNYLGTGLSE